jgi:K+-transporting ATPase ATPase C chain
MLAFFTLLTGILYPVALTGIAQLFFPGRANGSLIVRDGKAAGSSLIGQPFDQPWYFWGRLSATSPTPYSPFNAEKGTGSSGSNLGPLNPALREAAEVRIKALRQAAPTDDRPVPVDLVTASGSGLDPHISPAAAEFQVPRVARARGRSEAEVREAVTRHTETRAFGVLGQPRVNVLKLNLDLDARFGRPASGGR